MSPNVPKNLSNIFVDLVEYRALRDVSGRRRTIAPALSDDYTCSTSTSSTTFRVRSLARDPSSSAHQSPALSRGCLYVYAGRETSVHLNHLCSRPSPYALFLRTAHTSIVYLPVLVFIPPFLLLYFYFLFFFDSGSALAFSQDGTRALGSTHSKYIPRLVKLLVNKRRTKSLDGARARAASRTRDHNPLDYRSI